MGASIVGASNAVPMDGASTGRDDGSGAVPSAPTEAAFTERDEGPDPLQALAQSALACHRDLKNYEWGASKTSMLFFAAPQRPRLLAGN